jgi:hypothetical protein
MLKYNIMGRNFVWIRYVNMMNINLGKIIKLSLYIIKYIMGEWMVPRILNLGIDGVSGQLYAPDSLPPDTELTDKHCIRGWVGRSGRYGEETTISPIGNRTSIRW